MLKKFEFQYESFADASALSKEDFELLASARKATSTAFAPYSNFKVGAAAKLSTGEIIMGSNQESASYPVGICAERTLLNSIGSQHPNASLQPRRVDSVLTMWCGRRSAMHALVGSLPLCGGSANRITWLRHCWCGVVVARWCVFSVGNAVSPRTPQS